MAGEARMTAHMHVVKAEEGEAFIELTNDDIWLVYKTGRRAFGKEHGDTYLTAKGYQKLGKLLWQAFNRANANMQRYPGMTEAEFKKFFLDQHTAVVDSTNRYLQRIHKPKLLI